MSKLPVTYSELDACSPPVTPPEVVEWSEQVAGSIKSYLSHDNTSVDPQDIFLDSPSCGDAATSKLLTIGRCNTCGCTSEQFTQPMRCQHCNSLDVLCDHPSSQWDRNGFVCSWCNVRHGASNSTHVTLFA